MRLAVGLSIAFLLASTSAAAKDVPGSIAMGDRAVARTVQLAIPQDEIATAIEVGRVASDSYGGGLLGALIIASMDDKKETMSRSLHERAEATVRPLREALKTFDVACLALATTRAAMAKTDWFQADDIIVTDDASTQSRAAFLNASGTPQAAFVTYRYDLAPDFTYLRVIADIALVRKSARGARPASPPEPFYAQSISSIVQLRTRSYDHGENVAQWAADDGRLARASLTAAFAQIEGLIPFALGLSQADITRYAAKNRPKAFGAGFNGPRIDAGLNAPEGILLWSDGLVAVQPAPGA